MFLIPHPTYPEVPPGDIHIPALNPEASGVLGTLHVACIQTSVFPTTVAFFLFEIISDEISTSMPWLARVNIPAGVIESCVCLSFREATSR